MAFIANQFGVSIEGVFEQQPQHCWDQRAPMVHGLLAFNQANTNELPRVAGRVVLAPTAQESGLSVAYHTTQLLRGMRIEGSTYETPPFNTFIYCDTETGPAATIARDAIVLPFEMPDPEKQKVGVLFVTAALEKWSLRRARLQLGLPKSSA